LDVPPDRWSDAYGCFRADGVTPFPAEDLPLARALRGEPAEETEIRIVNPGRPDGAWILVGARPLVDEAGDPAGGIAVITDITRRKEAESRLRTLTNAVEQTADSVLITDRNGGIVYVNPAFEQTTGYAAPEVLGHTPALLKSGLHDSRFYEDLWSTVTAGRVFRSTITNRKKSGQIYFAEQTITPMRDDSGRISHFVSVVKDVTEQRKLQWQEDQMRLARAVQQRFYDVPMPAVAGYDIAGAAFPADQTGGDYFDVMNLPRGQLGLAIGDVCGHGIGSALMMAELRACLRAFATRTLRGGRILTWMNRALASDFERNRYATLMFCRLDPRSGRLVYSSAGHVPGFLLDAGGRVKRTLPSTDVPLGLFAERRFRCSRRMRLAPGDLLVLLTDGIVEAERPDATPFGTDRAVEFVRAHRQEPAERIVSGLYAAVREYTSGLPQTDDITAIVCKVGDRAA
jgi:sigma-B regulation protein RsbU (phosphoserine phosphatase)